MKSRFGKVAIVAAAVVLAAVFFAFDLGQFLTLDALKTYRAHFQGFYQTHALTTMVAYTGLYVLVTALSLPGAAIMTLAGGALFGLWLGTLLVSFASTTGATCAFLVARYLLRDTVRAKFGDKLKNIDDGIEREGAFYLFTLRLIPALPFFVINLVMGLTPMRTATFFVVSQLGMLPGTMVFVNAGTQLSAIESLSQILSPQIIGSFVLLGLFPLIAKRGITWLRARRRRNP